MTKVFIAASTPVMRAGLRALLAGSAFEVVGESSDLREIADLSGADVLVIGDEPLLQNWRGQAATLPLAVLVLSDDRRLATQLGRGATPGWGMVSPDALAQQLQTALEAVAQGLVVLPPSVANHLLDPANTPNETEFGLGEPLTGREQEILELLSQGLPNKLIARQLQISEHTVKFHVSSLYTKLDASSRAEAVSRGARLGLITF